MPYLESICQTGVDRIGAVVFDKAAAFQIEIELAAFIIETAGQNCSVALCLIAVHVITSLQSDNTGADCLIGVVKLMIISSAQTDVQLIVTHGFETLLGI